MTDRHPIDRDPSHSALQDPSARKRLTVPWLKQCLRGSEG